MSTMKARGSFRASATTVFSRRRERVPAVARRLYLRLRDHDDAQTWHALGAALVSLGDRAAALVAFRNALRLDATRVHSQLALGNLLFDSGQCELAFSCFDTADAGRRGEPLTARAEALRRAPGEAN